MRVGFTGTQQGMTAEQLESFKKVINFLKPTEFHHGDCIGADEQAHNVVRLLDCATHIHPPILDKKRAFCKGTVVYDPLPYLERNRAIVNGSRYLIATPKEFEEQLRSGTWATVRYAQKVKRSIILIYPDGSEG